MNHKNISITGDLGSGKSSVCAILKEELNFEVISVGTIQRKLAEKYKMNATEFNIYMETHPEIDIECDNAVAEIGKQRQSIIFDSRLAWYFVPNSFKVYLSVIDEIAAKRIFLDKKRISESYSDIELAKEKIKERRESEILRFKKQYNIDMTATDNYDLVIDTSVITPKEAAQKILSSYQSYIKTNPI